MATSIRGACTCKRLDDPKIITHEEVLKEITNKEKIGDAALGMILIVGATVGAVFLGAFLSSLIPIPSLGWVLAAGALFVTMGATTQAMNRYLIQRVESRIIKNEKADPQQQAERMEERKKTNLCPIGAHTQKPKKFPQTTLPPIQE